MSIQNLSGQTLGQYELRDLLGAGGMGAVYRGYQSNLKRYVAIKVLASNLAEQPGALERFNREAQTSAALEHANIIRIYDYGTQRGISYLVMQLLTGGSLQERIAQRAGTDRPLPSLGEIAGLLKQVASGLDYAHSQGVIHRDIKPSNVMFDNHGTAYLVDFGIAKLVQATSGLTASGMVIGTWGYMAPEQWKTETLSPATDQYALAVMTYALITGQMPFDAPTPAGVMHRHLNEMPTPVHSHRPDVPEAVTAVIERALSKRQEDRFPSVTAFAQAFEKSIRGQTGEMTGFFTSAVRRKPQPTALVTPSQPVTASRPIYKHPVVWGLVAILVVALAVIVLLASGGGKKSEKPGATSAAQIASDTPQPAIIVHTPAALIATAPSPTPAPGLAVFSPTPVQSPSPTETPPPTWTNTAPPTETPLSTRTNTPPPTPTWTNTPPPTETPDLEATVEALMVLHLSETAESWTETPSPTGTATPDLMATAEAVVIARLTATAESWTETPSPTVTPLPPTWTNTPPPTLTQESPTTPIPTFSASASARLNGIVYQSLVREHSGSASLATALSYYGWNYDPEVIQSALQPGTSDPNVSPSEIAFFVNQQTVLPEVRALYRYGGDFDLIERALSAGFPVLIETGIDVDGFGWMGHYETLVAYDDSTQTIWVYDSVLGSNGGFGLAYRYDDLDARWRQFNRVFVMFFTLDREMDARAVLGPYVDPTYAAQVALEQARQEARANPSDAWAWFNAGTSSNRRGQYYDAAIYFDEAFRLGVPWRTTWYLFGPYEAYYNTGRYDDVILLANNTEATSVYIEETYYWRGMAYAALGQTDAARTNFNQALALNPGYAAAQVAQDQIESGTFTAPVIPPTATSAPPLPTVTLNPTIITWTPSPTPPIPTVTLNATIITWTPSPTLPVSQTQAASSAAGLIAFQSRRDGNYEIYVMNPDGSSQRNLTQNSATDWRPAWSPDGSQIAFASDRDGSEEIYVMNADGKDLRRLTTSRSGDGSPTWSPDGNQIAFISARDGDYEIYVMNADGSDLRRLTDNSAGDGSPTWSPDGSQIVFDTDRDGVWEIYVMNADGSNPRRLTQNNALDYAPVWSPDGSQITFTSNRDGNFELYSMAPDGSTPYRIADSSATDYDPTWSPDGSQIAFGSDRDGNFEIYVMNADGSSPRNLTNTSAIDEYPAWQPVTGAVSSATPNALAPTPIPAGSSNEAWTPVIQDIKGIPFVYVPAGCFMMGSTDTQVEAAFQQCKASMVSGQAECYREWYEVEEPAHEVCLSAYWIGQTEVTNAQYKQCVDAGACIPPASRLRYDDPHYADYPVVFVDWNQANTYAQWMGGNLPTEAQWEYSARGPEGWGYPWGNVFDGMQLNYCDVNCTYQDWRDVTINDGYAETSPVGSYPGGASWVGALDMAGNVWEWIADWFGESYYASLLESALNPTGPASGKGRVTHGGSWYYYPSTTRAAFRIAYESTNSNFNWGFRVVVTSPIS